MSLFRVDSPNQFTALEMERETVFSMWYRPIWSCDFQCNLHSPQYSQVWSGESLSFAFSCQLLIRQSHGGPRLDSYSMGLTILSALVRDVV